MSIPALVDLNAVVAPRPVDNLQGDGQRSLDTSGRTSLEKSGSASDLEKPGAEKTVVTKQSVFDDSVLAKYVPALPREQKLIADCSGDERHFTPPDSYEGKHRFDPQEQWTEAEERAVVRKCDWRIVFPVCIFFAALQLDRGNILNALSDNFLRDNKLTTNDYNLGQTIFYVAFLAMEIPSQLISKRIGVENWTPALMIMWSIVAISQCRIHNKTGFFVTRAFLGLLEGGWIPNMILYLSYFYTGLELPMRIAFFWMSFSLTTIIGNFIAAGVLQMRRPGGWAGWRYLFLVEGCITLAIGIFAFFWLPPSPTRTAGGIRGKGWFSEREEKIIVNRVLRDDPTKSDMNNRQALSFKDFYRSLLDFDLIPLYLLGLTTFIAASTVVAYFSLTLRALGFSTFRTNLLAIPFNVIFFGNTLLLTYVSKRFKERSIIASIGAWWTLIFIITLVAIPNNTNKWAKYAILTLLLGAPYSHPILVSWTSRNAGSVRTRTVSAALYSMAVQLAQIIGTNIYHKQDAPFYHKGNKALLGIVCLNLVLFYLTKVYYIYRNKQRSQIWDAYTPEEKDNYLATTKDLGNRRLDFVLAH